ncbi:MAG: cyclic nucleotide-binding domain-containing protein [Acidobacteria bacterium]|nr:cyclic nucleotide-binding domain-containing protein [Acidobacteriota bacterium]
MTREGKPVAELGPGDFVGELSLLDPGPRDATVTALTPVTVMAGWILIWNALQVHRAAGLSWHSVSEEAYPASHTVLPVIRIPAPSQGALRGQTARSRLCGHAARKGICGKTHQSIIQAGRG